MFLCPSVLPRTLPADRQRVLWFVNIPPIGHKGAVSPLNTCARARSPVSLPPSFAHVWRPRCPVAMATVLECPARAHLSDSWHVHAVSRRRRLWRKPLEDLTATSVPRETNEPVPGLRRRRLLHTGGVIFKAEFDKKVTETPK